MDRVNRGSTVLSSKIIMVFNIYNIKHMFENLKRFQKCSSKRIQKDQFTGIKNAVS